jgi:hypothetical protein
MPFLNKPLNVVPQSSCTNRTNILECAKLDIPFSATAASYIVEEALVMSCANNDILLIDHDPKHDKAFDEALMASEH